MNPKMSIPSTTVLDGTRVALLCAVLLLAVGCAEGDRTPDATAVDPVRAALVAESAALAPGDTVQLGLHFRSPKAGTCTGRGVATLGRRLP
jgi:hypothetical protein